MQKWLGLTWIDWLVLVTYLVGITALGVMAYRKIKDMTDYFMGGRRFGKIFMMFFAFGAGTSSEQAVSVVAGTWRVGLAGIWWQFLWLWATPFYWLVAPILRRMRALTVSDFFEARYGTATATLYAVYGILFSTVFMAGMLFGGGKMANALTGGELDKFAERADVRIPKIEIENGKWITSSRQITGYEFAILGITVLFVIYGMAGGLAAAVWTDFVQGLLTISFSFMLLPWIYAKIGGFDGLFAHGELKEGMFNFFGSEQAAHVLGREPITVFYVFMLSLTALTGIPVQPHIMGVCGAGKTEFEGRFGFTFGNFLKRFCTVAWTFTGLACIIWYLNPEPGHSPLTAEERIALTAPAERVTADGTPVEVTDEMLAEYDRADKAFADELFGRAAYDILPSVGAGLVGLLLASLLATIMSSADAQMVVSSGLLTENIYRRLLVRGKSQRHYLWAGRVAGLVIVALALILQTTFSDVIDALKILLKTPAPIGISLWIGIVWRGWTPAAVWVSSIVSYAMWALTANFPHWFAQFGWFDFLLTSDTTNNTIVSDAWTMVLYLAAGLLSGLLVSWVTPRTPRAKLDHFFLLLRTPVRRGEVVASPCDLPDAPEKPIAKLIDHPDFEIPRPSWVDIVGFAGAWLCVGLIIWMTWWLSHPPG